MVRTAKESFDLLSSQMREKMLEEWGIGRAKKSASLDPIAHKRKPDIEIE